MPQDDPTEQFEIFSETGQLLGRRDRQEVHREGHLHRAVHVAVVSPQGWLLQQRSAGKDLFPGIWDIGVGEHVQPGEDFAAAARRGLVEELGVTAPDLVAVGTRSRLRVQGLGTDQTPYHDYEEQQLYVVCCEQPLTLRVDQTEVQTVRWLSRSELTQATSEQPQTFTPWCLKHVPTLMALHRD